MSSVTLNENMDDLMMDNLSLLQPGSFCTWTEQILRYVYNKNSSDLFQHPSYGGFNELYSR